MMDMADTWDDRVPVPVESAFSRLVHLALCVAIALLAGVPWGLFAWKVFGAAVGVVLGAAICVPFFLYMRGASR